MRRPPRLLHNSATGSVKFVEEHRDGISKLCERERDGFSEFREGQAGEFHPEHETEHMQEQKANSGRNKFDVLVSIEKELEETVVNYVGDEQEIVEIAVDSSAVNMCVADPEERCRENEIEERGETRAAASGSALRVDGESKLEFIREGKMCCSKFLDADVKTVGISQRDGRCWNQRAVARCAVLSAQDVRSVQQLSLVRCLVCLCARGAAVCHVRCG